MARYDMPQAAIFSGRCSVLALLLGALACGDGSMSMASGDGANRAPGDTTTPAALNPTPDPAAPEMNPEMPAEAPATPSSAAPSNGSGEGTAQNPVMLSGQ